VLFLIVLRIQTARVSVKHTLAHSRLIMHLQFTSCKIQEAHNNNARFDDDQCKELPIHSGLQGKQVMTWFTINSLKIYSSQGVKFRKHITNMHSLMMTNAQYLQFGQSFSVKQF
jgi:hypothetical protein